MAMTVEDIMIQEVVSLSPNDFSGKALELMKQHKIHHLVIKEGEEVVGMLSDRDLRMVTNVVSSAGSENPRSLEQLKVFNVKIKGIMTPSPLSVTPDCTIQEATQIILDRNFHSLPVVVSNKLVGIVTDRDILKAVASGKLA